MRTFDFIPRWQVGLPRDFDNIAPHNDLSQITGFKSIIDQVLSLGDIIYIPANHTHNGVALEECLNYSVGFRAPSQQEMLSSLADFAIDNNLFNERYTDNEITPRDFSGEIKRQEIARFKHMLQQLLETEQFTSWAAQFLSQSSDKPEFDEQDEQNYSPHEINEKLKAGVKFVQYPGIKAVFVAPPSNIQDFIFYIQGEKFSVPLAGKNLVIDFLNRPVFFLNNTKPDEISMFFIQIVTTMVNSGYWYPED